ncbi:MAG: hypothetical protein M5R36_00065 [Deltaproteobacteria bacterium]|nr:hypothetical protein [Deltaproteobacteria bacterium]
MSRRTWTTHVFAVAAFAGLAVAFVGLPRPDAVLGNATDDVFTHLHLIFWQAYEAARGHPVPIQNNLILYPDGGKIWLSDPVGGLVVAPVAWLAGAAAGYNLLLILDLVFAGWAMFWLVRRMTGNAGAAFAAGTAFAFCAFHLAQVANGVIETLTGGWLALFLGFLLTATDAERYATPGRAAPAIGAAAVSWWFASVGSHWYHGVFAAALFAGVLIDRAFGPMSRRALRHGVLVAVVYAVLVAPVVLLFLGTTSSGGTVTRSFDPSAVIGAQNPQFSERRRAAGS